MATDASALRAEILNRGDRTFARASNRMLDQLIERAPYRDGQLVASGALRPDAGGGPLFSAVLEFTAPQALWTDEGTKGPYEIEGNPWLVFEVGGETVFVKSPATVTHPGITGTRWWSDFVTQDRWAGELQDAWAGG